MKEWEVDHPSPSPLHFEVDKETEAYAVPRNYDDVADHEARFFEAVRSRKKTVENEEFGNTAALGCHLANYAYFNRTAAVWDPSTKKIKG